MFPCDQHRALRRDRFLHKFLFPAFIVIAIELGVDEAGKRQQAMLPPQTWSCRDALLLAERRGDVEMAQLAVRQIEAAFCDIARRRGRAFRRFL